MPDRGPLVRSSLLLRGLATAVTLTSLASMTAFAATHVQNEAAPLKPAVPASSTTVAAAATAGPTATSSTASKGTGASSRSTTLTGRVPTTTTTTRTKTHSS